MDVTPSATSHSDGRHRWIQAALAVAAVALLVLAAVRWWSQRQSPLVFSAMQQTGGRLLLHNVQNANVRILVVGPTIRGRRLLKHPHDCMVAEYAASTIPVRMRSLEVGGCGQMLFAYSGFPQLISTALRLLLFPD
jgi:hypothetical protein